MRHGIFLTTLLVSPSCQFFCYHSKVKTSTQSVRQNPSTKFRRIPNSPNHRHRSISSSRQRRLAPPPRGASILVMVRNRIWFLRTALEINWKWISPFNAFFWVRSTTRCIEFDSGSGIWYCWLEFLYSRRGKKWLFNAKMRFAKGRSFSFCISLLSAPSPSSPFSSRILHFHSRSFCSSISDRFPSRRTVNHNRGLC